MKPSVFSAVSAALALVAAGLLLAGRPPAPATAKAEPALAATPRQLTVTGEGVMHLRPDTAHIQFGVRSEGATARDAEALNGASADKLIIGLTAKGLGSEDIRLSRGEMHAITSQDVLNPGRITGYRAESRVLVAVRNVRLLNQVREAALASGATDVYGTTFSFADPEKAKQSAIKAAMDNAEERAAALGLAGGVKTRALVSARAELDEEPAAPGPAFGGDLVIRARVTATFQLQ